jgi:uncharacterized protein YndB with AHSA1/START domain
MTQIHETITIDADPERVWALAGDPARIGQWLPALASSELDGDERSCTTVDGAELKERIVEHNDAERYYVYEITEAPMPVESYRSVLSVHGHDGHSHVGWQADFEAGDAAAAAELEAAFAQIYREGLENLRAHVEGAR